MNINNTFQIYIKSKILLFIILGSIFTVSNTMENSADTNQGSDTKIDNKYTDSSNSEKINNDFQDSIKSVNENPNSCSSKIKTSIEKLDKIILFQKFDSFMLDGPDRPDNAPDPNWDVHPEIVAMGLENSIERAYRSKNTECFFLRSILHEIQDAIEINADIAKKDNTTFEILGSLAHTMHQDNEHEVQNTWRNIFKNTENNELLALKDLFQKNMELSKAFEKRAEKKEKNKLKNSVNTAFDNIPTIWDLAKRVYLPSLIEQLTNIVNNTPQNASTPENRLTCIFSLMQAGELFKLLPNELSSNQSCISESISCRDKFCHALTSRLENIINNTESNEHKPDKVFADTKDFLNYILTALNSRLKSEEASFPEASYFTNIKTYFGYNETWKSKKSGKKNTDPNLDPDKETIALIKNTLEFIQDKVGKENIKNLDWFFAKLEFNNLLNGQNTDFINNNTAICEYLKTSYHNSIDNFCDSIPVEPEDSIDAIYHKITDKFDHPFTIPKMNQIHGKLSLFNYKKDYKHLHCPFEHIGLFKKALENLQPTEKLSINLILYILLEAVKEPTVNSNPKIKYYEAMQKSELYTKNSDTLRDIRNFFAHPRPEESIKDCVSKKIHLQETISSMQLPEEETFQIEPPPFQNEEEAIARIYFLFQDILIELEGASDES